MIYHHKTSWKNTIAFSMLFDVRDFDVSKSQIGLLHFAEHLMFIETKKLNENKLRIKHELIFDVLDAYTSLDYLDITVVCSRSDFAEVCSTLKEMLYSWKCNQKQFTEVKQTIIEEIQYSNAQPINIALKALKNPKFDSNDDVIGTTRRIKALKYTDLREIKKVWNKMINTSPRNLLIAGPKLTTAENKILNDLFDTRSHSKPVENETLTPMTTKYLTQPTVKAIVINTNNSSPFFILLQRLYYIRHLHLNPDWEFSFTRDTNHLIYSVYNNDNTNLNQKTSENFLLAKPTKQEFTMVQDIITKQISSLTDSTDPQELIGWLDIFQIRNIPEFQGKNLLQITKIYKNIDYPKFISHWETIFNDLNA